ncbi:MAG: rhodanese-like domain-containing protein [Acidobacteriota bacterium]|nr:rhodanese-like domain-containing protein [Acidobacteriota bacterium]
MTNKETKIQTISTEEVKQRLEQKNDNLEFWNVLTDEYFSGEMIPGSRRVALDRIGREINDSNLSKDSEIIVYCAGPNCPQSAMAAQKLAGFGYANVRAYEGGLEEWKNAGYAIERLAQTANA